MLRLHQSHPSVHQTCPDVVITTRCFSHVPPEQIAAFDEGVTCKRCLKRIEDAKEAAKEAEWEDQQQREAGADRTPPRE